MSKHYDALETRNPVEREAALMAALPAQVAHAQKKFPSLCQVIGRRERCQHHHTRSIGQVARDS